MTIYLKQPQRPPVAIRLDTSEYGHNGYLTVQTVQESSIFFQIGGNREELARQLRHIANSLEPKTVAKTRPRLQPTNAQGWAWLTPDVVIQYFEQSPMLSPYADDVRAALNQIEPPAEQLPPPSGGPGGTTDADLLRPHVAELLNEAGQPIYGAQTKVADLLELPGTGGSYRRRILEALEALREELQDEAA